METDLKHLHPIFYLRMAQTSKFLNMTTCLFGDVDAENDIIRTHTHTVVFVSWICQPVSLSSFFAEIVVSPPNTSMLMLKGCVYHS